MSSEVVKKIRSIVNTLQEVVKSHEGLLDDVTNQLSDEDLSFFAHCLIEAEEHLKEAYECYSDAMEKVGGNLPDDYEECGYCGFDHAYEPEQANKWHAENPGQGYDPEKMAAVAEIANALDGSDDADLQKKAGVLDDLLIAMGQSSVTALKKAEEAEIEKLRKKYRDMRGNAFKAFGDQTPAENEQKAFQEEAKKAIDAKVKKYRPLEAPLMTHQCPDHPGTPWTRISDGVVQCPIDKKIYDFNSGFVTMNGDKVPGTSMANQNKLDYTAQDSMSFATRDGILNGS